MILLSKCKVSFQPDVSLWEELPGPLLVPSQPGQGLQSLHQEDSGRRKQLEDDHHLHKDNFRWGQQHEEEQNEQSMHKQLQSEQSI